MRLLSRSRNEGAQPDFVELAIGAHTAANIQAERLHLHDGIAHILRLESARQEQWPPALFADCSADGPVVGTSGTAEFLHAEFLVARIEQDGIDEWRNGARFIKGFRPAHMDHLHQHHLRQCMAKLAQFLWHHVVDQLQRAGAAALVLIDDGIGVLLRGEQERFRAAIHLLHDLGNQRLVNHARAAGHGRHQSQRIGAMVQSQFGFFGGTDAADFYFWNNELLLTLFSVFFRNIRSTFEPPLRQPLKSFCLRKQRAANT